MCVYVCVRVSEFVLRKWEKKNSSTVNIISAAENETASNKADSQAEEHTRINVRAIQTHTELHEEEWLAVCTE